MFFTPEQRALITKWKFDANFMYNLTVEYLTTPYDIQLADREKLKTPLRHADMHQPYELLYHKAKKIDVRTAVLAIAKERAPGMFVDPTPYSVLEGAIRQACTAMSTLKKKVLKLKTRNVLHYRSRRGALSIVIRKANINERGIFTSLLNKGGAKQYTAEPKKNPLVSIQADCILHIKNGKYYLCIPYEKQLSQPENQRFAMAAIDPGVRTFATVYSEECCIEIGKNDSNRIFRLCRHIDKLISRQTQVTARTRARLKKAVARAIYRIQNLVMELHRKTAKFLATTFRIVVIPPFETQRMSKKLHSKTARMMMTFSHYTFRTLLENSCRHYGTYFVLQDEAYTSKTCGVCGHIHDKLGSSKVFKCPACGAKLGRDTNGARHIWLRALGDDPLLKEFLSMHMGAALYSNV